MRAWWRVSKWHYSSKQIVTPIKWKEYASLIHTKWTGKRWRMSSYTVFNLFVLPEDSADCRASTWQEETMKLMINRFQRLIVCIIVPDNHCSPLWMINISKTVGKASVQKPIFSALSHNYGRPSDVSQLIRIIAFKHICCLCFFTTKATSQLYPYR